MIRNLLLLALVTLPLAACGDGSGGSGTAAAAVSPNTGLIDRTPGVDSAASVAPVASNTTSTAPITPITVAENPPVTAAPPVTTVNGVATLDWQPPTQNSDGSALTNLAGYTVYYGTSPDELTESVKVSNPGVATYVLSNLASGTWYFAVTAYSSAGVESDRSGVV